MSNHNPKGNGNDMLVVQKSMSTGNSKHNSTKPVEMCTWGEGDDTVGQGSVWRGATHVLYRAANFGQHHRAHLVSAYNLSQQAHGHRADGGGRAHSLALATQVPHCTAVRSHNLLVDYERPHTR